MTSDESADITQHDFVPDTKLGSILWLLLGIIGVCGLAYVAAGMLKAAMVIP